MDYGGGIFGFAELSKRMSMREVGYNARAWYGRQVTGTASEVNGVLRITTVERAIRIGTIYEPVYDNSWSASIALSGLIQQQQEQTQSPPERRLTEKEVAATRNNVAALLKQENCAKFVENVLNTANELFSPRSTMWSDDILGMFDAVKQQGGFTFGNTIRNFYKFDGATTHGSFRDGTAGVEFSVYESVGFSLASSRWFTPSSVAQANLDKSIRVATDAIHEIMHLAGYTDLELAVALATLNKDKAFLANAPTPGTIPANNSSVVTGASSYWGGALRNACKPAPTPATPRRRRR